MTTTSEITPSHWRDLVAEITHDDSGSANALFRALVLSDNSTPKGAAIRRLLMKEAFYITQDCDDAMKKREEQIAA